jgi:hypothetical protein
LVCANGAPAYRIVCRWCGNWFFVCVKDFRGQVYCPDKCREPARKLQKQTAQARYLEKLKGKKQRALAAKAYRRRLAEGQELGIGLRKIVIDQGVGIRMKKHQAPPRFGVCAVCTRPVFWFGDRK